MNSRIGENKMKTFNSIEELKPYYNKNTNTYEFVENGFRMDVEFKFNLDVNSHIYARNINTWNINTLNIDAWDITSGDINAWDINAGNINAGDINAVDISYYAVCFAYENISCTSIKGHRENAKHFVLDGKITIQPKKKVTLEIMDEQIESLKKQGII